ncbi:MAG: glycosyltransferase [Calditrichaceae bacterium]|nr:glycosyltransferase family 2 protein [Calditrichia bacterium]NUQ39881.1 glycosyltransferase [Calditrichaceae bacterium]
MFDTIVLSLYLISLLALGFFGLHKYFLLLTYQKYKKRALPEPPEVQDWPEVTVQLPVYNERYVIKRLLKTAVNLDYPRERLHVQVLDDSTDGSERLAARLVKRLQEQGFRIEHLRRRERRGFKAGALAQGLERSGAEYLAIFDADFVPPGDFLKKTIPYLAQPGVGMVQARWGHLNRNYSLLTRLQAIFLDAHFIIEHLARNRSGRFFNFNGTAGVWRRQAIIEAGGWQHDTLTEDLDLSYRAQLAGWKFIYLPEVVAPAELPGEMNAYKNQQHRWAKGAVQTALKLIPHIWRSKFPFRVRLEATIHLSNNFTYLLMAVPALLLAPVVKAQLHFGETPRQLLLLYLLVFLFATLSVIFYYAAAIRESRGKLWPHILYVPLVMALGVGLSLNNGRAALEALFRRPGEFRRTPKFRLEGQKGSWRGKRYRPQRTYQHFFELLIAGYFTCGSLYFLTQEVYYSLPFFLLFQGGFYYTGLSSLLHRFTPALSFRGKH